MAPACTVTVTGELEVSILIEVSESWRLTRTMFDALSPGARTSGDQLCPSPTARSRYPF